MLPYSNTEVPKALIRAVTSWESINIVNSKNVPKALTYSTVKWFVKLYTTLGMVSRFV